MSKYKKALESMLINAYSLNETQAERGYYLRTTITNDKDIKLIRKMVARLQRKGRM